VLRTDTHAALREAAGVLETRRSVVRGGLRRFLDDDPELQQGLERLADATGDRSIGAQLGWLTPIGSFGILDYIGSSAPTMDVSKRAVCRYLDAVATGIRYEYRDRWMRPYGDGDLARDFLTALIVPRGRAALGEDPFARVCLSTAALPDWLAGELGDLPVEVGRQGVELKLETLHRPLRSQDARLHAALRASAAQLGFGQVEPTLRERIDAVLLAAAPVGRPSVDDLALLMHMSPRTLRRRLSAEGTTTRQVVDDVLRRRAVGLLSTGRSAKEVAAVLGFADTSSFSRAFVRWTGRRPSELAAQAV
jgi:AraC-like DNA-binding protein